MQAEAELALAEAPAAGPAAAGAAPSAPSPRAGDVVIRAERLSKCYLIYNRPQDRLKQALVPRLRRLVGLNPRTYYREFWALRDVSFEVRRGETVGIVGRNGSGKSTLLQILCGTLHPNGGTVEVRGRVAALLELGSGFNPEFTGRENVYLYASMLGLSRAEVDARFDAIAAFADIGDFIDQPLKTYSSGMHVRLAFAVAVSVDPDILVVDEALAVGDEAFQRKCFARIEEMKARGATILFVSHATQSIVQLCSRALLIDGGELLLDGPPKMVVGQYQRLVNLTGPQAAKVREVIRNGAAGARVSIATRELRPQHTSLERYDPNLISQSRVEYEADGARIYGLRILNSQGNQVNVLEPGRRYTFEYYVKFERAASQVAFGMLIKTVSGFELGGSATNLVEKTAWPAEPGSTARVRMAFNCMLAPGVYFLNAGTGAREAGEWKYWHRVLDGLAFRVADTEVTHSGVIDFSILPTFEFVDPSPAESESTNAAA